MTRSITSKDNILNLISDFYHSKINSYNYPQNIDLIQRLNDSKTSINRWKDVRSYEGYFMKRFDKVISNYHKSIQSIPDGNHFVKNMLEKSTNLYYHTKVQYYNPKVKAMQDFIPITEMDPILSYKYYYLREMFKIMNVTPISNDQLRADRYFWRAFNKASEDLHKSLENKLTQFEQISHSIKHQVTQCLVHMMTCQSHDGIQYVYGNIFALVKLGFYTTLWFNFTECTPYLLSNELVPAEFLDLFFKDEANVPGYTKFVVKDGLEDMRSSIEEAFDESPLKDMLDSRRKSEKGEEDLFYKEWARLPDDDDTIPGLRDNNSIKDSKWFQSITLGVLVCFCVTVGVLPYMGK